MYHLPRITLALAFTSFVVGCGDNIRDSIDIGDPAIIDPSDQTPYTDPPVKDPDPTDPTDPTDPADPTDPTDPVPVPELVAQASLSQADCDSLSVNLETVAFWKLDNAPIADMECRWTFSDGSSSTDCFGAHAFAAAGSVDYMLTVTDPVTGIKGEASGSFRVRAPIAGSLKIEPPSCGFNIGYSYTVNEFSSITLAITPPDKVVAWERDGWVGNISLQQSGDYDMQLIVEDERPNGLICSFKLVEKFSLRDCPKE